MNLEMKKSESQTVHVAKSPSVNSVDVSPLPSPQRRGPMEVNYTCASLAYVGKYFIQGCLPGMVVAVLLVLLVTHVDMQGTSGLLWIYLLMYEHSTLKSTM
jgi:hypothetical protein